MKIALLAGLLVFTLAACADDAPQEQARAQGRETTVEGYQPQDIWTVTVSGNGHPQDKIERMALWRSAKITLDRGADKFKIIGGSGVTSQLDYAGQTPGAQIVHVQGAGPTAIAYSTAQSAPMPMYINRAGGDIKIKIFRADLAPADVYDARQIMQMYGAEFAGMQ